MISPLNFGVVNRAYTNRLCVTDEWSEFFLFVSNYDILRYTKNICFVLDSWFLVGVETSVIRFVLLVVKYCRLRLFSVDPFLLSSFRMCQMFIFWNFPKISPMSHCDILFWDLDVVFSVFYHFYRDFFFPSSYPFLSNRNITFSKCSMPFEILPTESVSLST